MRKVTPHPATLRGLRHVAQELKSAGHMVIEWQGPFHVETTLELIGGFWAADGGTSSKSLSYDARFRLTRASSHERYQSIRRTNLPRRGR